MPISILEKNIKNTSMNYNFIEIGTSNFNTLIEISNEHDVGISIDPIKSYLDQLPEKKNVLKLNTAIGPTGCKDFIDVYYIPEHIIDKHNFPKWLKGCNSVSKFHPQHINLNLESFVKKIKVSQISIVDLFINYNVVEIDHLKIDTEGLDCELLLSLYNYLKTLSVSNWPNRITFENNSLTDKNKLNEVLKSYSNLGYIQNRLGKQDLELIKDTFQ